MSPFCICQSCTFCEDCNQELGYWETNEHHVCDFYVFMDKFHLEMEPKDRQKAVDAWYNAGGHQTISELEVQQNEY